MQRDADWDSRLAAMESMIKGLSEGRPSTAAEQLRNQQLP